MQRTRSHQKGRGSSSTDDSQPRPGAPAPWTVAWAGIPIWLMLSISLFTVWALAILWSPEYLPFQDHPSHLYRQHILIHYSDPGREWSRHFVPNLGVIPNQLSDLLIVALGRWFGIPVDVASRICLSLYILALPAVMLWFLRVFSPQAPEYALLGSALTFNYFLLLGNENFVLSLPLFLALLAQWRGGWTGRSWGAWAAGAALATVLYGCHMVAFGSAAVVLFLAAIVRKLPVRQAARELAVFLPGLLLFAAYILRLGRAGEKSDTQLLIFEQFASLGEWGTTLTDGLSPFGLYLWRDALTWLYLAGLVVLIAAGLIMRRGEVSRPLLVGTAVLCGIALLLPEWFGVWRPGQRIALLCLLALTPLFPTAGRWRIAFVAVVLPLLIYLRVREGQFMREGSETIAAAVGPFRYAPLPETHGGTVLPVVTEPYLRAIALHRVFEYYHLIHGGVSPFHLMSADFSVRYRNFAANTTGLYDAVNFDPATLAGEFDLLLLIGKDGEGGPEWVSALDQHGWAEIGGNPLVGVYSQQGSAR